MKALRQIVKVPEDHEIKIKIPQYLLEDEVVEVILIIKKRSDDFDQKINDLKDAMKDELFLNDLKEISEEFEPIDLMEWDSCSGI